MRSQKQTARLDVHLAALTRLAQEMQHPNHLYVSATHQTMRALSDGRFVEGEQLAQQVLAIGQRLQGMGVDGVFGMQMFTLRREQGRLQELAPVIRHFVQQHGAASTWRPGLALIYSELGREREARTAFEQLAAHDFVDLPQDGLWLTCMAYLAEVCAFLGDARRAATLYRLLLPYNGYPVVIGGSHVCYGAASRYLGMLAATEIADALCISLNTVATHVRNILTKTGTANRTAAAAYAQRRGLRAE